ncbi:hypothetical protein ACJMK2_036459 [Sinanodonta woodiana]|uniref:Uncharacterized protein n=1 Tax=Sinanodonta woodiana TaxID=1069815 RepID=A0ABD3WHM4_SINWO
METLTEIMHILFILLLCEISRSENCTKLDPCVGHRPKSDNGCCLGNQGSPCGVSMSRSCDEDLGFSCNQTIEKCEGKYNLTATDVGMKSLTLSWEDFKPQTYLYEYSIMLSTVYTPDTSKWETLQVGNDSSVTLSNLLPDTLYFMQVGTWSDPFKGLYQILSEVIMVHTKAAEFCIVNGNRIGVGQRFEIECEDRCICQTDGQFKCDPICSSSEKVKLQDPRYDCKEYWAADPCCPVIDCHLLKLDCKYQGENLPDGYQWTIGCQEACQCLNGRVTCEPVCSEMQPPTNCDGPVFRQDNESCCGHWECTNFNLTSNAVKLSQKVLLWAENVTFTTAILRWSFQDSDIFSKGELTLNYKNNASNTWMSIQDVIFSEKWFYLSGLSHSTAYEAVIFSSPFHDKITYEAGRTSFMTLKSRNKNLNVKVSLRILEISTTAVSIESRILPRYHDHLVSTMKILWSAASSQNISSFVSNSSSSLHTISGMEQNTLYVIWLEALLNNGVSINSTEVHFVTKVSNVISTGLPSFHPNIAILVSIPIISVVALTLLVVMIVYTSRTRHKRSKHVSEHSYGTTVTEMQMGKYQEFESSDASVTDEIIPSTITDLQHL